MPRRRARKLLISGVVTPDSLSRTVIGKYVSTARERLADWATTYQTRINDYVADVNRQSVAQAKLATWYNIYVTVVYPRLKEIFATARSEYIRRLYRPPVPPAGTPATPTPTFPPT
jgi:hypothetical protein